MPAPRCRSATTSERNKPPPSNVSTAPHPTTSPSTAATMKSCRAAETSSNGSFADASRARTAPSSATCPGRETTFLACVSTSALALRLRGAAVVGQLPVGAALVRKHVPAGVERDLAARLEHLADLLASPLHPRLHPRQRKAQHVGGVLLGHPLQLRQGDGFAVGRRQRGHEHG